MAPMDDNVLVRVASVGSDSPVAFPGRQSVPFVNELSCLQEWGNRFPSKGVVIKAESIAIVNVIPP